LTALLGTQAADHWRTLVLRNCLTALQQAAQLKRTGQRILANFLGRRIRAAWNAWSDMVQVRLLFSCQDGYLHHPLCKDHAEHSSWLPTALTEPLAAVGPSCMWCANTNLEDTKKE